MLMMNRMREAQAMPVVAQSPAEVKCTTHAINIATNFLNELWRTHNAVPSVNISSLLAQREYCINAALRLSLTGRGSISALPGASVQTQHFLAAAAVDAVGESWKLHPKKLKHVIRATQTNLKSLKLDKAELCPPINPPVPMKVFDHPHLCPPISIEMRTSSPDLMDETEQANESAYEEARSTYKEPKMKSYEKALWKNMQQADDLEEAFATKGYGRPQTGWTDMEPLTPIAGRPPKPVKPQLVPLTPLASRSSPELVPLTPKVAEPVAPSCKISLQWLKELSAKNLVELSNDSTFLALADAHLTDFDTWKVGKTESQIQGAKANIINARLSSALMTGRKFDFVAVKGNVHRIEGGMIIGATTQSKLFPSRQLINGKTVLVLASEHPISK